jgi:chromosome segregation ATPase
MTIQRHRDHLQDRVNRLERQLNGISHELQTQNTKYEKAEAELSLFQDKERTLTQLLLSVNPREEEEEGTRADPSDLQTPRDHF